MRGVFNPSILNHRARNCRAALLPAWMQALVGEMGEIVHAGLVVENWSAERRQ
jgi:hypothetical protein